MTELLFRAGTSPAEAGLAPPRHSVEQVGSMRIERDVAITLSDGTPIYVDVFRPEGAVDVPVILAWSPYGKHTGVSPYEMMVNEDGVGGAGVDLSTVSSFTGFEGPDPVPWSEAGYAVVKVDPRATWWSEGDYVSIWGEKEARDIVDVIEWAGTQPWSSGTVGMTGVSYLAIAQWWAAALHPEHLKAINPCEGLTDPYREWLFHGGIRDTGFPPLWQNIMMRYSLSKIEAISDMAAALPLDGDYWESKRPDLERVEVPTYVIASWSDQTLHTRGTIAAFERIASKEKYLEVHGAKKWEHFHRPSTFERQRAFFDRYLKGEETEVSSWPMVRYELRSAYYEGVECTSDRWPLPDRKLRTMYLDAADGTLVDDLPTAAGDVSYEASEDGGEAVFEHVFDKQTDIVGSAGLRLWLTIEDGDDADLFVGLKKLDADGKPVDFPFQSSFERGPVALGWLRASHRELDPKSTPDRPLHTHRSETPLVPGEPTLAEVEIWPSATRFEAGERLQLVVRGSDLYTAEGMASRHQDTRNKGSVTILTGGDHDSSLVVGVLES